MKQINYVVVPSSVEEDDNKGKSAWKEGKFISLDEGPAVTLFLGHRQESVTDEEGNPRQVTMAFPVRVVKPVTRSRAINAAEMAAYSLLTPMDVASFGASLSRKFREDPESEEVAGHDDFIRFVKAELDSIGITSNDPEQPAGATVAQAFSFIRSTINSASLPAAVALGVKGLYPEWKPGIPVKTSERYRVGDNLYECDQDHTTQDNWKPGQGAHSLWHEVTEEHAGTKDDPIPYNESHDPLFPGMVLEAGKHYRQDDVVYKCTRNSWTAVVQDLSALVGHYVEII